MKEKAESSRPFGPCRFFTREWACSPHKNRLNLQPFTPAGRAQVHRARTSTCSSPQVFKGQVHALEQQQAQELLSLPADSLLLGGFSLQHLAASAPTTLPRMTAMIGDISPLIGNSNLRSSTLDVDSLQGSRYRCF